MNVPDSNHSLAILKLFAKKKIKFWPNVNIIFKGNAVFCHYKMFNLCKKKNVGYITGIARNNQLIKYVRYNIKKNKYFCNKKEKTQIFFGEFDYAAESWNTKRRIISKTECNVNELKNWFIVTNLIGDTKNLYEKVYCARCEVENRIKEQKPYLFSNCTSEKDINTNQFRGLLAGIAYTLLNAIRLIC